MLNTQQRTLKNSFTKMLLAVSSLSLLTLTGCATSELLDADRGGYVTTESRKELIQDQVIAFGKSSTPLQNMPSNSVVIVGEQHSYVLSKGGAEFVQLLSGLDTKNIHVDKDLAFRSENNDGYFSGELSLSYAKLKDEFVRSEMQFFLQNNGRECTNSSDKRMAAQRFCFNIPIKGGVYPRVSNLNLIQSQYQPLSKPYSISIYTINSKTEKRKGTNAVEKLVMLPFALAFDVITLPLQLLD